LPSTRPAARKREQLGVRRRIVASDWRVGGARDDGAGGIDDHGADRHFARCFGLASTSERLLHESPTCDRVASAHLSTALDALGGAELAVRQRSRGAMIYKVAARYRGCL
jgi:hypothetical protein